MIFRKFRRNKEQLQQERIWEQMGRRMEHLEHELRRLADKPAEYRITIEQLHVQQPVLESLLFRLDRIDVDELSGSLNLGNNFGVSPPSETGTKEATGKRDSKAGKTVPHRQARPARGKPNPGDGEHSSKEEGTWTRTDGGVRYYPGTRKEQGGQR